MWSNEMVWRIKGDQKVQYKAMSDDELARALELILSYRFLCKQAVSSTGKLVLTEEHMETPRVTQDLHIHTIFSADDTAVAEAQTVELIAQIKHADVVGISDHFEHIVEQLDDYQKTVAQYGFLVGTEVNGGHWAVEAAAGGFEYYIQHTRDRKQDYDGLETLLATGKPVIVAHPIAMGTDLKRVPHECYIEINNRYVWRRDWRTFYTPFLNSFRFVLGSDAHQPHWLNQNVARFVGQELGITETLLFNRSSMVQ